MGGRPRVAALVVALLEMVPPGGGASRAETGDRRRTSASGTRRPDRWDAAIGGYALLAALCQPLSAPAAAAVLLPGVLLAALRARRPVRPLAPGAQPRRAALQWLALAVLGGLWWLVAFRWGNDTTHPTLSLLLDPVLDTYWGRVAGYSCWLAAGRWLVTR